jgi:ribosome-associated protein
MNDFVDSQIELAPGVVVPSAMLRFQFARSSGPGGQNVNKRSTRVSLVVQMHDLRQRMPADAVRRVQRLAGHQFLGDRLMISADSTRYQAQNRQICIDKLRQLISKAMVKPKKRKRTRPTRASKERRIENKKRRGERKRQRGRIEP